MEINYRREINDALSGNAATCGAILERVDRYIEDDLGIEPAELITAVLALTEAVRILTRVQMCRD